MEFVVLDRPNPLGGVVVQGNVLDPAYSSFVGLYPVPMRHGLTAGELTRLLAPGDGKFGGVRVRGVRFIATDHERYDPTRAAIAALVEIRRLHPDRLSWRESHFDRLAGTDRHRRGIIAGASVAELTARWDAAIHAFEDKRSAYLLYR